MYLSAKERMIKRAAMDIKKNQIVNYYGQVAEWFLIFFLPKDLMQIS